MKNKLALVALLSLTASLAWGAVVYNDIHRNILVKGPSLLGTTTTTNAVTRALAGPVAGTTIDFTSTYSGIVLSTSIAVVGAVAGDPCFVGVPTAAAALKAKFGCYVDATDSVKVWFSPENTVDAQLALASASPSTQTATVPASSICTVTALGTTAAIAAGGIAWSVTTTTATFTGPNTVTTAFAYHCVAPVDPASGAYFVRVISNQ